MINTIHRIGHSGLFDTAFYLSRNPDLNGIDSGALSHYHQHGWREGRKPNAYFDPHWYLSTALLRKCSEWIHGMNPDW
ncbi:hypothetical protein [Kozakia baliensis]|uniref:hypothetical protein n=1 Tax=Kozakia baliensis TaxID=153496 RepID=UPI00087D4C53|nr:hypothetical protein [Kozakia baliensis]AOX19885.1 hypothetical protein A0U90_05850 [Kozakia baliensis]